MSECNAPNCSTHGYIINTMDRFDNLICQLVEGQQQLQLNVVRLTEQIEITKRLHDRVDSLERFMWKMVGVFAALSTTAGIVLPLILKFVGS